jgi:hypothetical protein
MMTTRVIIDCRLQLYTDLITRAVDSLAWIEVVDNSFNGKSREGWGKIGEVDVVVFTLEDSDSPDDPPIPGALEEAKLLAFSPNGDHGFIRSPGETMWEEVRPFSLDDLVREVGNLHGP